MMDSTKVVVEQQAPGLVKFHIGWRPDGLDPALNLQVKGGDRETIQDAMQLGRLGRRGVQTRIPSTVNSLMQIRGVTCVTVAWEAYGMSLSVFLGPDANISSRRIIGIIEVSLVKCGSVTERNCTVLRQGFWRDPVAWWKGRGLIDWLGTLPHTELAPSGTA